VDEGIVEGCKDVGHTEDKFTFTDLRAESHDFLFLHYLFLGRLSHVRTFARKREDWSERGYWVPWLCDCDQKTVGDGPMLAEGLSF
jgi:hypothetical protein